MHNQMKVNKDLDLIAILIQDRARQKMLKEQQENNLSSEDHSLLFAVPCLQLIFDQFSRPIETKLLDWRNGEASQKPMKSWKSYQPIHRLDIVFYAK